MTLSTDECLLLLDALPAMVWRTNEAAECLYCNRTWLEFTGWQKAGRGGLLAIHPEDRLRFQGVYRAAALHRQPFQVQYRLRRRDGVYRTVLDQATPLSDAAGRFTGYLGACMDVTGRLAPDESSQDGWRALMPICSHCKSIRDADGEWRSVESFLEHHSEAGLSHGICPNCVEKLYPELSEAGSVGESKAKVMTRS